MLSNLAWLPAPPENYREMVRVLKRDAQTSFDLESVWERLKGLAAYAIDEVQLAQLARIVAGLPESASLPDRLKMGILGDGTLSLLGPAVVASALRWDLRVEVTEGEYGRAMNEAWTLEAKCIALSLMCFSSHVTDAV